MVIPIPPKPFEQLVFNGVFDNEDFRYPNLMWRFLEVRCSHGHIPEEQVFGVKIFACVFVKFKSVLHMYICICIYSFCVLECQKDTRKCFELFVQTQRWSVGDTLKRCLNKEFTKLKWYHYLMGHMLGISMSRRDFAFLKIIIMTSNKNSKFVQKKVMCFWHDFPQTPERNK